MTALLTYAEALQRISLLPRCETIEDIPLADACGRVLATDAKACVSSPAFSNSAMDGIAVRHADGAGPFRVLGTLLAQSIDPASIPAHQPGACVRIMTGAMLPSWADTIVPVEQTEVTADQLVRVVSMPEQGMHVRLAGEDFKQGESGLVAGMYINAERIMAASALGIDRVNVYANPRLWLVSTGDELQEPGTPLKPGAIYNSSRAMLTASAKSLGLTTVGVHTISDDHDGALRFFQAVLADAGQQPALILTTGAVSAGEKDFIPAVARELGFEALFHKVAIRPSRPVFVARRHNVVWIGLPGNPVSTSVGWHFFVRPILARMAGIPLSPKVPATLEHDVKKPTDLRCFYRAHVADGVASVFPRQGSGEFRASIMANAYVELPESDQLLTAGTRVMATILP